MPDPKYWHERAAKKFFPKGKKKPKKKMDKKDKAARRKALASTLLT